VVVVESGNSLEFSCPSLSALKFQSQIEFIIISIDIDNEPKTTQDKLSCLILLATTLLHPPYPLTRSSSAFWNVTFAWILSSMYDSKSENLQETCKILIIKLTPAALELETYYFTF
jgi:hypothetical protein